MTSYDPHPVCSTPFIGLKRGVRVISEAVRAIYGGHMTISDTHETEAPNLYGKITHTYGVVVRGYEVNIPVIPTFWIGRPLSPPTLKSLDPNNHAESRKMRFLKLLNMGRRSTDEYRRKSA